MAKEETFSFKVLVKQEDDAWAAHCLELVLVAVAESRDQAEADIIDVVDSQVRYAIANDNLHHLYHAAPVTVWKEYFA